MRNSFLDGYISSESLFLIEILLYYYMNNKDEIANHLTFQLLAYLMRDDPRFYSAQVNEYLLDSYKVCSLLLILTEESR